MRGLGDSNYLRGRMRTANLYFTSCVSLCREHGLLGVEGNNLYMASFSGMFAGDLEPALQNALAAVEIAVSTGNRRAEWLSRHGVGHIRYEFGEWEGPLEEFRQGRENARLLEAKRFESHALSKCGMVEAARGNLAEGRALLQEALEIARETGTTYFGPAILAALARITEEPGARRALLKEGEEILNAGCVGHNSLFFYRDAMEGSLAQREWGDVAQFAAALEATPVPSPCPGATCLSPGRGP